MTTPLAFLGTPEMLLILGLGAILLLPAALIFVLVRRAKKAGPRSGGGGCGHGCGCHQAPTPPPIPTAQPAPPSDGQV